ncbi:hypothetical protein E4U59_006387 [Claviceps monticola]|nr:hypothetical protein E4U59_006387 [Claviceps monticola]
MNQQHQVDALLERIRELEQHIKERDGIEAKDRGFVATESLAGYRNRKRHFCAVRVEEKDRQIQESE